MHSTPNPFESIDVRLQSIENSIQTLLAKTQAAPERKFYTIQQAALKLNVAEITMYRNVQAGRIPSKKIGSRVMIPSSFVDR